MTPEELFYSFPEPVPDLCWRLRDLVLEVIGDAEERVRPGWRRLAFTRGGSAVLCAIAPQRDHARLLFERGAELSDPDARLQGAAGQGRYLRFDSEAEIDDDVVRAFLTQLVG
ncbi:MAG: DUF1801 domain-containing protein [Myxococcales bacterium]|nr:DUF1801 domain-containing protein [Myxococcales bacterium]